MGRLFKAVAAAMAATLLLGNLSAAPAGAVAVETGKLTVGSYVQFGRYDDTPIIWQVIENEACGSIIFAEKILTLKAFDARGDSADGRDSKYDTRALEGSNYWPRANLREWLNSAESQVSFSHQAPDAAYVLGHSYADEPGFLNGFSARERSLIAPVTHKVLLSEFDLAARDGGTHQALGIGSTALATLSFSGDENAYFQWVTDQVFLLSGEEVQRWVHANGLAVGGAWSQPLIRREGNLFPNPYWLRTPGMGYASAVAYIDGGRIADGMNAYRPIGVRPALCLRAGLAVVGAGDRAEPYTIAPSAPSPWAVPEVEKAVAYGLLTARVLDDFQAPITRAEFSELAVRLYERLAGHTAAPADPNPFQDSTNPEVLKAYRLGIVAGMGEGIFAPDNRITREQIAVMFYRTLRAANPDLAAPAAPAPAFADGAEIAGWARLAVDDLSARGIIGGVGDGRFDPRGTATREQAIALVRRVYELASPPQ